MTRRRSAGANGFTLVEVVVALAIIGLVAVVLMDKRVEVVRSAAVIRDQRLAWTLAGWKMGELERDSKAFQYDGVSDTGDFDDLSTEYRAYKWEYVSEKEEVPTNDPQNPDDKPKEIFRVRLKVVRTGEEKPLVELEGMFPMPSAEKEAPPAEEEAQPAEQPK